MFGGVNAATQLRSNIASARISEQDADREHPRIPPLKNCLSSRLLPCALALLRSIWTFYGDVIYVASWHVNDARDPCLPSIFMNNCVRGSGWDGGVWLGEGPPHVHQKSPEHGAWVVKLPRPPVHMPAGTGPPVHPDSPHSQREDQWKANKETNWDVRVSNRQTSAPHSGS